MVVFEKEDVARLTEKNQNNFFMKAKTQTDMPDHTYTDTIVYDLLHKNVVFDLPFNFTKAYITPLLNANTF